MTIELPADRRAVLNRMCVEMKPGAEQDCGR